jgi:hypothetical protein
MRFALLAASLLVALPAQAARIDFAGEWFNLRDPALDYNVDGSENEANWLAGAGLAFSGLLNVDESAPDSCAISSQGCFYNTASPWSVLTDGKLYEASTTTVWQTQNPIPSLSYWAAQSVGPVGMFLFIMGATDSTGIVPGQTFINYHRFSLTAPGVEGYGFLTRFDAEAPSAVPLPAALPLFASALGGAGLLSWLRRRRHAL